MAASRPLAVDPEIEDDLASVVEAMGRAEFALAESVLAAIRPRRRSDIGRTALLRARIARIGGDAEGALNAATEAAASHPESAGRMEASVLAAGALKRSGRSEESRALLERVRAAIDGEDPRLLGRAVYLLAVDAWEERHYERAQELAQRNVGYGVEVAESRALLGWIDVKRERYAESAVHFAAALTSLVSSGTTDVRLRARLVHALGIVASETVDLKLGARVRREFEAFAWPPALAVERFNAQTCLRFLALLEGDVERAWFLSRDAAAIAPNEAYAAIGETNAAVASRLLGDDKAAELQAARAWELLQRVRWSTVDHEGRVALTNFAIECARSMPAEASKALTKYRSLTARRNAGNALEADRRVVAFESVAAGSVAEALGNRKAALRGYAHALDLWIALGYDLRAALVSLDVYRLTGDEERLAAVEAVRERAPSAWFLAWQKPHGPLDRLTPAERVVLFELLRGKTAKDIARELDRSQHTVINHTRKVFAAFDVSSRAKLLARCAELGIVSPTSGRRPRSNRVMR